MVLVDVNSGVGTITMNRPDKRNALSPEMVSGLDAALSECTLNSAVKVIVLRGNGPAFCAGADLDYLSKMSVQGALENLDDSMRLMRVMKSLYECPKPVIAAVHGPAIAGGCGLATVCDIVIAAQESARFGYSEVGIGFIPAIVMVFLIRKVGDTQARRLVLTAETIDATEARNIGLITKVVPDHDLEAETQRLAGILQKNSSSAMALSKSMLASLHGMSLDAGLVYAATTNAFARSTDDCKDGVHAFLTKNRKS
jgi:methylglutaconyl-CoA hydratase